MPKPGQGMMTSRMERAFRAQIASMEQGATPMTVERNERMNPKDLRGMSRTKHPNL